MENNLIYSNVATELLEIIKYFDSTLNEKVPVKLKENLNKIKNESYVFEIDKSKELSEQEILPETKQILSILYLKYLCTTEEANEIIEENRKREIIKEEEKRETFNPDNIFKNKKNLQEEQQNQTSLIKYEEHTPFYKKIIQKIKMIFKNILGK